MNETKFWIFVCNDDTQFECWERKLFGVNRAYPLKVRKGDFCLLYNYSSAGEHLIHGIYQAVSNGGKNIEPTAWGGKYPFQVRVKLNSIEHMSIPKYNIRDIVCDETGRVKELILGQKAHQLLEYFSCRWIKVDETGIKMHEVDEDYRRKYPRDFHCSDGHDVRSLSEQTIDEWLSNHLVYHEYERLTNIPENLIPDFTVYDREQRPVFIEFWGKIDDPIYLRRRKQKSEIYYKHKCRLIEIDPSNIKNLDFFMREALKRYNIHFE